MPRVGQLTASDPLPATTPIGEKVKYVKNQASHVQDREHVCHWPGCGEQVHPALWGCPRHWFKLPKPLRDRIWATYRPGQEKTMRVSRDYLDVAEEVREWILANHQAF